MNAYDETRMTIQQQATLRFILRFNGAGAHMIQQPQRYIGIGYNAHVL
jgi:hypothetical protein